MREPGVVERTLDRLMPAFFRPLWERLRSSQLAYRMAHGTFWSSVGAGSTQIMMLVTSVVAARLLGRQQFGQYGVLMSTLGMFGVVAGFGIGATATKYIAEFRDVEGQRAGRIMGLSRLVAVAAGLLSSLLLLVAAPWLAVGPLAATELRPLLQLGAVQVFFSAITSAQFGILAGFEAFRGIARLSLLGALLSCFLVIGGIVWQGVLGAVIGQAVATALLLLAVEWALQRESRRHGVVCTYKDCSSEQAVLFGFSLPAVLSGIMVTPITWCAVAIIVNQPAGYAEMGLFNAANSWQKVILFIPGCLGTVSLPLLSSLQSSDSRQTFRQALNYQVLVNAVLATLPAMIIAAASPLILLSYGSGFRSGWPVLVLLAYAGIPNAIAAALGTAIASMGAMWWGVLLNAVWGFLLVTCAYFLRHLGALGLAGAYGFAYTVHLLFVLLFTYYYLVRKQQSGAHVS